MQRKLVVPLALATMWLMGGMGYPVLTVATKHLSPMNLVFVRTFGTAIILTAILLVINPSDFRAIKLDKDLAITFLCAILFYPICSGSLAFASTKIPGALTALLYSTLPVISTIYLLLNGKRVKRGTFIGLMIALVALVILVGAPSGKVTMIGVVAGGFSVLTWFVATEIWIKYNPKYSLLLATSLQAIFGSIGSFLAIPLFGSISISRSSLIQTSVIFLIFSLATQHFAYLWLTTNVSPVTLMLFSIVNPFVAGITGYLFFQQEITFTQILAGLLMILGIYKIIKNQTVIIG